MSSKPTQIGLSANEVSKLMQLRDSYPSGCPFLSPGRYILETKKAPGSNNAAGGLRSAGDSQGLRFAVLHRVPRELKEPDPLAEALGRDVEFAVPESFL